MVGEVGRGLVYVNALFTPFRYNMKFLVLYCIIYVRAKR
jgi:hypothetical protein